MTAGRCSPPSPLCKKSSPTPRSITLQYSRAFSDENWDWAGNDQQSMARQEIPPFICFKLLVSANLSYCMASRRPIFHDASRDQLTGIIPELIPGTKTASLRVECGTSRLLLNDAAKLILIMLYGAPTKGTNFPPPTAPHTAGRKLLSSKSRSVQQHDYVVQL
ncbi:hypothetical protein C7212DRAFT_337347 [Tuber magnatum]|uniref:Uncharacterized protein n=1 Tax=Tuber magnatum TaxID=42249 RepID=A0A317SCK7_9PEZI|nr:hypothetical protein C7212DRAFT_337347 [Tuber magnatum]